MRKLAWQHLPWILVLVVVFLGALTEFFYKNDAVYENSNLAAENQVGTWTEKVGRLAFLPKDEMPDVALVSEPELLREQVFFKEAKKGDIVLIYTNAKKAILYDPIADKIISMAGVNIGDLQESAENMTDLGQGQFIESGNGAVNQF